MKSPSPDERLEFFQWSYAGDAFKHTLAACRHLMSVSDNLEEILKRVIVFGLVVSYGRPFTRSAGLKKPLDIRIVPKALLPLHKTHLDLRHKAIAHIDAKEFESDDSRIGNINKVVFDQRKDGTYAHYIYIPSADLLKWKEVAALSEILLTKAEYHTKKFLAKYYEKLPLAPGRYELVVDPAAVDFLKPFLLS